MTSYNSSRKFDQNNFSPVGMTMENHNGNSENGHAHDEFEDDGEGEFVVICKKHHQRGTKTRMRGRGGGAYHHNNSHRVPLTAYPYHPSNIRRTQMLLEQQNNAKNNNGDNSSTATTETSSTNDSSIAKNSLPSSSSGTSTLSTASGPTSDADASSSTTGDVNVNELQTELDAITKPKFVEAPVPAVNPWKVFNAAAVLGKKVKPSTVSSSPLKLSSAPEAMTNGISAQKDTTANKVNGTSDNAAAVIIPATSSAPKTWAAIATKASDNAPVQTATRLNNNSKPITTTAKSIPAATTTTASTSAQSAPGPWVSGRVLKLQQSSPNYTEKLKPTDWPSLSEVSHKLTPAELTTEQPDDGAKALEAKPEEKETAAKTAEKPEVNFRVTYKVASTQTYSTTTSTYTQTHADSKPHSSSSTSARTDYFDGESRGRGRGRGRGASRGATRGRPNSANGCYKDQNNYAPSAMSSRTEYTDYPPEFTTLIPPFSTVPDFIMPYVAPTTCRVAPIMSPDLAAQWLLTAPAPPPRANVVDLVKNQIEYYFSQENLEKDFYLRRKMDEEGYLPIRLIASFQRVQSMTTDYSIVTDAILASSNLEIRQATASVRTKHDPTKWPIDDGPNTQARNGEDSTATSKVPGTLGE